MADNQKDLVLAPNEYSYVLDQTKGNITCWVGPCKTSLSQTDKLVKFNIKTKKFEETTYEKAVSLFTTVPNGWYCALKNPAKNGSYPTPGTANNTPELNIGHKINIKTTDSFALYPGQMADVIKGHSLRSNQYLVARVYDADSANCMNETTGNPSDEGDIKKSAFVNGQILIIKGTEISFYIPPTGIEVIAINNNPEKGYVRDAVTLERLEYCILKDEDGNRRYVHGPEVVFPTPTESFIQDGNNNIKRKAIELSDISGVYVKVISDYKDATGEHKAGDELFITGKDQMIYYPRPEHTFITYNGRVLHHAIAIPKGEGRYIMNRMTGEIKTVRGPAMYLPDPRTEVSIKRNLSRSQCELWYPDNQEVLAINGHADNHISLDALRDIPVATFNDLTMKVAETVCYNGTPTKKETNKINRTNTFTPPRTISLDSSKYEGAVSIDVWTGYAVNVISKDGSRNIVRGPQTILLDYDQSLETLELSTGKPKTTERTEKIAFLRYENNRISDIVDVETSDFVKASIKMSYLVSFDEADIDKWFSVDNYVGRLCDWTRSKIKEAIKEYTIIELYESCNDIVLTALFDENKEFHKFEENGMKFSDVEILSMTVEDNIKNIIDAHQDKIIRRALDLNAAMQSADVEKKILILEQERVELVEKFARYKTQAKAESYKSAFEIDVNKQKARDEEEKRKQEVLKEIQSIKDSIFDAEQERMRKEREAELAHKAALAEIEAKREAQSAEAMRVILEAIGPDLASAMNSSHNHETVMAIAEAISPYAIANGENVSDAVSKLLRGTTMEQVIETMKK